MKSPEQSSHELAQGSLSIAIGTQPRDDYHNMAPAIITHRLGVLRVFVPSWFFSL